ncbi:MAG: carbohydrate ABC transporter permease [Clostridia bacterium]|jgi:putative aldouronate transport system permease protein|nr:carbohydrate ABC transporter permease [Clostridia bacterium]
MISQSKAFNIFVHALLVFLILCCVVPFWLLIASSFTSEASLVKNGYSLIPKEFSLAAYKYLWTARGSIGRAYFMSVAISAVGVTGNVLMCILFAYPLSRRELPGRGVFSFLLFFTMLFNGGLVPTYLVYTNIVNVKDSFWGLVVPYLLFNPFLVIMMRTYFTSSIPNEVLEAARIDGASEVRCLTSVVVPMSKPIIATVALMTLIAYWNNWTNGIYFLTTRTDLYGIQNYLNDVMNKAAFLQSHTTGAINVRDIPNIGVRMAVAVVAVVPLLILYPFFQKYFVKGVTLGSVKG